MMQFVQEPCKHYEELFLQTALSSLDIGVHATTRMLLIFIKPQTTNCVHRYISVEQGTQGILLDIKGQIIENGKFPLAVPLLLENS